MVPLLAVYVLMVSLVTMYELNKYEENALLKRFDPEIR
jgi:hypothetical protein